MLKVLRLTALMSLSKLALVSVCGMMAASWLDCGCHH